jgi:hypothetical protein
MTKSRRLKLGRKGFRFKKTTQPLAFNDFIINIKSQVFRNKKGAYRLLFLRLLIKAWDVFWYFDPALLLTQPNVHFGLKECAMLYPGRFELKLNGSLVIWIVVIDAITAFPTKFGEIFVTTFRYALPLIQLSLKLNIFSLNNSRYAIWAGRQFLAFLAVACDDF